MAGSVAVIGACFPKRDARQRIEIATARSFRKLRVADGDDALQHQREEALLLAGTLPMATVRVISVVPFTYCAPESTRNISPSCRRRSLSVVTR